MLWHIFIMVECNSYLPKNVQCDLCMVYLSEICNVHTICIFKDWQMTVYAAFVGMSFDKQQDRWYMKMRDFYVLFLQKAHYTEHPSRGCPHLVLISQLSRLKQCG